MAYRITDDCMACGDCRVVCPIDAIDDGYGDTIHDDLEDGGHKIVDAFRITDSCIGCGDCVDVCPTQAIVEY